VQSEQRFLNESSMRAYLPSICHVNRMILKFPVLLLENTRKAIGEILDSYGIDVASSQLIFVTDNGSNLIAALDGEAHLRCACHCLNLTVQQSIESVPLLKKTLEACSCLVTHFKRTGLQSKLTTTLKKDVDTRWNSIVEMIHSIIINKDRVIEVLRERAEDHWIDSIDFQLLDDLCVVLLPFKFCSQELSSDKQPTLHLVLPFIKIFKVRTLLSLLQSTERQASALRFTSPLASFPKSHCSLISVFSLGRVCTEPGRFQRSGGSQVGSFV
jgi:hypothetical protein